MNEGAFTAWSAPTANKSDGRLFITLGNPAMPKEAARLPAIPGKPAHLPKRGPCVMQRAGPIQRFHQHEQTCHERKHN
jgi:hypothetical protein